MAGVQARGDVRGGQERLLSALGRRPFLRLASSALRDIVFFLSLRCGEIEAKSLHFSAAFSRAERSSGKEEDKEERKDDDVEETAQQTY